MSFLKLTELAQVADSIAVHVQKITDISYMVVIQPSIKLAEKYPQLTSPLQVIAAPQDLDREVMAALTEFTPALRQASSNIQEITDALEAATKAAREQQKNKGKTAPTTTASAAKPMQVAKPGVVIPPPLPDLFAIGDTPAGTAPDVNTNVDQEDDELAPLGD